MPWARIIAGPQEVPQQCSRQEILLGGLHRPELRSRRHGCQKLNQSAPSQKGVGIRSGFQGSGTLCMRGREDVNVVVALRAMGVESDQEVMGLVGAAPGLAALMAPSLQEAKAAGIFVRQQALEFMGAHLLPLQARSCVRPASSASQVMGAPCIRCKEAPSMHDRALCAASNCMCSGTGCPSSKASCRLCRGVFAAATSCSLHTLRRGAAGWSQGCDVTLTLT